MGNHVVRCPMCDKRTAVLLTSWEVDEAVGLYEAGWELEDVEQKCDCDVAGYEWVEAVEFSLDKS